MVEREPGSSRDLAGTDGSTDGQSGHTATVPDGYLTISELVVAVQLPERLLNGVLAVAAIEGKKPNNVLRDALAKMIPEWVKTPEFRRMADAYLAEHGVFPPQIIKTLGATAVGTACGLDRGPVGGDNSLEDVT